MIRTVSNSTKHKYTLTESYTADDRANSQTSLGIIRTLHITKDHIAMHTILSQLKMTLFFSSLLV